MEDDLRFVKTPCHPACDCREVKVKELVEAASEHLRHHCVAPERECEDCDRLEAAIEGVKG